MWVRIPLPVPISRDKCLGYTLVFQINITGPSPVSRSKYACIAQCRAHPLLGEVTWFNSRCEHQFLPIV